MRVITLCGSTKFKDKFDEANTALTVLGNVVLSIGCTKEELGLRDEEPLKEVLKAVHRKKIEMSEEIFVINVGGYIGETTAEEIEYAERLGRKVGYLEKVE